MASSVDLNETVTPESAQKNESAQKKDSPEDRSGAIDESPPEGQKKADKRGERYDIIHELMKGLISICLLVSVLTTLAMLADIYFSNSFSYLENFFFSHPYSTGDNLKEGGASKKSEYTTNRPIFELFDDLPDPKRALPESKGKIPDEVAPDLGGVQPDSSVGGIYETAAPDADIQSVKSDEAIPEPEKQEQKLNSGQPLKRLTHISKSKGRGDGATPRIAIIIDDMGFDPKIADAIGRIDKNITISILPGSPYGKRIAKSLNARGVQLLLHLPMEPLQYPSVDPGYGAILSTMSPDELVNILNRDLEIIPYVQGVNNHMGSRLTTISPQMRQIFTVLKKKQLFFIDSLTSNHSAGRASARFIEIPFASRDLFLDNIKDRGYIKKQFLALLRIARQNGQAIAIGHPYSETYAVLKEEIMTLRKNAKIVPVSQLVAVP